MYNAVSVINKDTSLDVSKYGKVKLFLFKLLSYTIFVVINLSYSILITSCIVMLVQLLNYVIGGSSGMTFVGGEAVGFWYSFGVRLLIFQLFYLFLQLVVNVIYEVVLLVGKVINLLKRG